MSRIRKYRPDVRLRSLLNRPGGVSIEQALSEAARGIETLRVQCIGAVDAKIEEIAAAALDDTYCVPAVYALADEIFVLAGTFGLSDVSRAAYSLCALLSSDEGARKAAAVHVHVDALRALRNPVVASDSLAAAKVLDGLANVTKRYAKDAAPGR